jgi:NADH:ubiquinone oxidoreductase subunit E
VKGAGLLTERLRELLEPDENGVSKDGLFSLECQRCVGACALAPVVMVGEKVYGNVRPDDLEGILMEYGYKSLRNDRGGKERG